MTRAPRHEPALDGVRAVAAFGVVATHAGFASGRSLDTGPFAPFLARLEFGVTLFFLLSGFLLFRPFAAAVLAGGPLPRVGRFWWRRLLRIVPAYWLAVTVTLTVLSDRTASGRDWLAYLTLTQTYTGHDVDPGLRQMWTLAVELSFYAVLPLLALAAARAARRVDPLVALLGLVGLLLVGGTVGQLVTRVATGHRPTEALLWLPSYLDWFGLGMLLAVVAGVPVGRLRALGTLRTLAQQAPGSCWALGALVFWLATLRVGGPYDLAPSTTWQWTIKHLLYGVAAFFLVLPVMLGRSRLVEVVLGNRVLAWLGVVSYGVYLWHLPLLLALQRALGWPVFGGHFTELWLLASLTATAVAAVSWYVVERPLLRVATRPWRRRREDGGEDADQRDEAQRLHDGSAVERVG